MAFIATNGVIYCTGDELWSAAPEREDLTQFVSGSDPVAVWPKSRRPVWGGNKYPALSESEFAALLAIVAES